MKILRANARRVVRQGPFQIRRMRPGLVLGSKADPALDDVCAHAALLETAIAEMDTLQTWAEGPPETTHVLSL
jgi:hypothetical protein